MYFPLGRRRVVYVLPEDPPTRLRALGATHLLLDGEALKASKSQVGDWLQRYDAELVDTMRQDFGPETSAECYLLRLRAESPPATK